MIQIFKEIKIEKHKAGNASVGVRPGTILKESVPYYHVKKDDIIVLDYASSSRAKDYLKKQGFDNGSIRELLHDAIEVKQHDRAIHRE